MRVPIEGELDAGVPGEVLDVLGVRAASEEDRETGVPEIVPSYVRQPRPLEEWLEVAVDDVLRVERRADSGAENEPESS